MYNNQAPTSLSHCGHYWGSNGFHILLQKLSLPQTHKETSLHIVNGKVVSVEIGRCDKYFSTPVFHSCYELAVKATEWVHHPPVQLVLNESLLALREL